MAHILSIHCSQIFFYAGSFGQSVNKRATIIFVKNLRKQIFPIYRIWFVNHLTEAHIVFILIKFLKNSNFSETTTSRRELKPEILNKTLYLLWPCHRCTCGIAHKPGFSRYPGAQPEPRVRAPCILFCWQSWVWRRSAALLLQLVLLLLLLLLLRPSFWRVIFREQLASTTSVRERLNYPMQRACVRRPRTNLSRGGGNTLRSRLDGTRGR